ncbi:MAG: SUMF1/EgtB/PvdO family nonheme iron enzyme [Nitrospinae bacterium]|nr:SUMF1/EgtB/PvdO family nonheme iron enzyme [Nitrospinota bacterium]
MTDKIKVHCLSIVLVLLFFFPYPGFALETVPLDITDHSGNSIGLYNESHALIIGVADYTHGWPDLPGVEKDIVKIQQALVENGFNEVVARNTDRSQLVKAFEDFINQYGMDPGNRLIFYFAGHGHTLEAAYGGEIGYIVPADAPNPNIDRRGFMAKAINMQLIEVFAKRIQSKHALFLFDSCFSGSIFSLTRAIPENISYKTLRPVRQFITAGSANETVPDESIFSAQFVEALKGAGDSDNDGYLTGVELGEFLQKQVVNYSRGAQHPQYGKIRDPHLDKGDFVFVLARKDRPNMGFRPPPAEESSLKRRLREAKQRNTSIETEFALLNEMDAMDISLFPQSEKLQAWNEFLEKFSSGNPRERQARERIKSIEMDRDFKALEESRRMPDLSQNQKTELMKDFVEVYEDRKDDPRIIAMKRNLNAPKKKAKSASPKPSPLTKKEDQKPKPRENIKVAALPKQKPKADLGIDANYKGMARISAGEFQMGATDGEADEQPVHTVYLDAFYMDKHEVAQKDFEQTMAMNPAEFKGGDKPVDNITWDQARQYCQKVGKRLPTEAEWEKAARAGSSEKYFWGNSPGKDYGWWNVEGSGYGSHPVGEKRPNKFGLFDMSGNLWEWVDDWFQQDYYKMSPKKNPKGPSAGKFKVLRGGNWEESADYVRSANRMKSSPEYQYNGFGFRCAVSVAGSSNAN